MSLNDSRSYLPRVLIAVGTLLLLGGLFVVRVSAGAGGAAPTATVSARATALEATVPPPKPFNAADLPTPFCWGCSWNQDAPLEFQIDLDLLAPLGNGNENAALWFRDFAVGGPRHAEWEDAAKRRVERTIDGQDWRVLPGDDPLLLESEPWVDQATLRFYPDVLQLAGMETAIPNLLMMLDLSRSWIVRGKLADDPRAAREDFRRSIRLGRLLRQDDVTLIQDLVAIACIRLGAESLYEEARARGDGAMMTATSLVLADKDAMRMNTMRRISVTDRALKITETESGALSVTVDDAELKHVIDYVRASEERRFRIEGLIMLQVARGHGTPAQREVARAALDEFSRDPDELFAAAAVYARDETVGDETLRGMAEGASKFN